MTVCPSCSSSNVVAFTIAPRGEPLRFTQCRACEHKWWAAAEERAVIALPDVLQRIGTAA
jgi:transposase-like protein